MDEIEFQCDSCSQLLRIFQTDRDKWIRCPGCGSVQNYPKTRGPKQSSIYSPGPSSGSPSNPNSDPSTGDLAGSRPGTVPGRGHLESSADAPHSLAGSNSNTSWSVLFPDGSIWGDLTREELEHWIREGTIVDQCFFTGPNYSDWTPVGKLFQSETGPQSTSSEDPGQLPPSSAWHQVQHRSVNSNRSPVGPNANPPHLSPQSVYPSRSSTNSHRTTHSRTSESQSNETTILILGIISLCTCCVPLGPIGLIVAYLDKKKENEGNLRVRNPSVFMAGVLLCVVSSAIFLFILAQAIFD